MNTFLLIVIILLIFFWDDDKKNMAFFAKKHSERVLVDTSILIDGRFLSVAKTGFINFEIIIPRSVVGELQILADGGDDEKRVRARYGLDIISELQKIESLKVSILADGNFAKEGVDNRLISLSKKLNAKILTADYNLNKVAKVEGLEVLNINELVQSVRAEYLPGEKIMLEITQKGNEKKQGVGHLSDGTMVVVENGENLVGSISEVEFIRSLQTAAGKMMFARPFVVRNVKSENKKNKGRTPIVAKNKIEKPEFRKEVKKSQKTVRKTSKNAIPKSKRTQKTAEASLVELANGGADNE